MNTVITTTSSFCAEGFDEKLQVVHKPYGRKLSEDEAIILFEKYNPIGIIAGVEPLTENALRASPNLKVVSRCGIGMDSVDLDAAKKLGISVLNTPEAPTDAVAELTIGLILALIRNIPANDTMVRNGGWKGLKGKLLKDKTIGIIGCGRIGRKVGCIMKAFGCTVLGYDLSDTAFEGIIKTGLDDLICKSDIISLHVPLDESTKNIISEERMGRMKEGSYLINASRGGLVDEDALYRYIVSGKLSGAAIDCFCDEPYKGKLKELDNVVLSPHMGSSTHETRELMESRAVENLNMELRRLGII